MFKYISCAKLKTVAKILLGKIRMKRIEALNSLSLQPRDNSVKFTKAGTILT